MALQRSKNGVNSLPNIAKRFLYDVISYAGYNSRILLEPSVVELCGIKIAVSRNFTRSVKSVFYRSVYEMSEARCVREKISADDVVLEIGTGIGFISSLCSKLIGSENVFSYEANPALIPLIRETYTMNAVNPTLINAFVGARRGFVNFYVEEDFPLSSCIRRSPNSEKIRLPCLDVNEEISRIKPSFLIIDIEGGEFELVPSMNLGTVQKVLIEVHERIIGREKVNVVRSYFTKCGFTVDTTVSTVSELLLERLP